MALIVLRDLDGIARIGEEPFTRNDLIPVADGELTTVAQRILETRGVKAMPRIEAVTLDASTDPGDGRVVNLMATASPFKPTRLQAHLVGRDGRLVFDEQLFVTGVTHTISDGGWTCRLTLDTAQPFSPTAQGRWDVDRWDQPAALWTAQP